MNSIEKNIIAKARKALDEKSQGSSYAAGLLDALLAGPTDEERAIAHVFDGGPIKTNTRPLPTPEPGPYEANPKCPECGRPKRHKQKCSIGKAAKKEKKAAKHAERPMPTVELYEVKCDDCGTESWTDKKFMDATCAGCGSIHVKKL